MRSRSAYAALTVTKREHATAIPEVVLYHRTTPTPCYRASYEPSLSIFLQGKKRIILGGVDTFATNRRSCCPRSMCPRKARFWRLPRKRLCWSCFFALTCRQYGRSSAATTFLQPKGTPHRQGLAVGETTVGLLSACNRLLDLLETPEDIPFLSPLIQREILYRLLKTPQADRLRAIATSGDLSQRTAQSDRLVASQLRQAAAYGGTGRCRAEWECPRFITSSDR